MSAILIAPKIELSAKYYRKGNATGFACKVLGFKRVSWQSACTLQDRQLGWLQNASIG
jgi:hypothetical protein